MRNPRLILRSIGVLTILALLVALSWYALRPVQAGDSPAAYRQDAPPALTVTGFTPTELRRGQTSTLTVFGTNFTADSVVSLEDIGALATTLIDASTLQAVLPTNLSAGRYHVTVSDTAAGSSTADRLLAIDDPLPTETPTNTPSPPISVTRSEPRSIAYGQEGVLSVFGTNFTEQSMVRLVGIGLLQTTYLHSGALTAVIPASVPPGTYGVQVTDPLGGQDRSPNDLNVIPPAPTEAPTREPLPPTDVPPTPEPPTPVPGQPSLVVRNFSTDPAAVAPGETTTLRFDVYNQGNRSAVGIAVAVDAAGKFIPANGQASAVVPDLGPGSSYTVTLAVIAAKDSATGPTTIPLALTYRDNINNSYTGAASLSVTIISPVETASQVILSSVMMNPATAEPGKPIKLTLFVTNSGNEVAQQVLVRVGGADSDLLLAGAKGDTVPLGDIAPGTTALADLPMIVSTTAKSGPQAQPVTISFRRAGEAQQVASSLTVEIAKIITPAPVLLLDVYDIGQDTLRPGERFTLQMTLKNVGNGPADGLMVTFGTVETSGGSGSGDGSGDGPGGTAGVTTLPSTTFAPVGGGGTIFVGTIEADGGQAEIKQDFLVNGITPSGLYNLPVTLRYVKPDGAAGQNVLQAAMMVVAPPRLQVRAPSPVPETVNVGEPFPITLEIKNNGSKRADLTTAIAEADNGEVIEGAETFVGGVDSTEDTSVNVMVMPLEAGPVEVRIMLHYLNDLNRDEVLVQVFRTEAVAPDVIPDDMPPDMPPFFEPEPAKEEEDDTVGRFLRGLLGLGS